MAMNGNALGDAIRASIEGMSPGDKTDTTLVWRAIGVAIVDYIKNNAEVSGEGTYKDDGSLVVGVNPVTLDSSPNTDVTGTVS